MTAMDHILAAVQHIADADTFLLGVAGTGDAMNCHREAIGALRVAINEMAPAATGAELQGGEAWQA